MSYLSRHKIDQGSCWALDGQFLPAGLELGFLLSLPQQAMFEVLASLPKGDQVADDCPLLAPLEPLHEVWACGVTYLRSRDARQAESQDADVYGRVYNAERPEVFFKALGWRTRGHGNKVRIRRDSHWNVPEPELVLVLNSALEIVGYCAGNDMSSRSIEGENPLYLPQAKSYTGACSIGPGLKLISSESLSDIPILLSIMRGAETMYEDATSTSQMKRSFTELASYLGREMDFPQGALLMTGTSLVPPESFTLEAGDVVTIKVGELELVNQVEVGS